MKLPYPILINDQSDLIDEPLVFRGFGDNLVEVITQ